MTKDVKYQCKRCFIAGIVAVEIGRAIPKTRKCPHCTGRMRLEGLLPAAGFRTKTRRNK